MRLKNKLLKITRISLYTLMCSVVPYSATICIAFMVNRRFNPGEIFGIFTGLLVLSVVMFSFLVTFINSCANEDKSKLAKNTSDAKFYAFILTPLFLTPILGIILSAVLKKCQVVESAAADSLMIGLGISLVFPVALLILIGLVFGPLKEKHGKNKDDEHQDKIGAQSLETHDSQCERGSSSSMGTSDRTQPLLQWWGNQHQLQNGGQLQSLYTPQSPYLLQDPAINQYYTSSNAKLRTQC